jgi:poly(3-hydroxybutyrate) depolymerase
MRKSLMLIAAGLFAAGAAVAGNCPNEMKAIDAKLSTNPSMSKEDADKVAQLRAQGEADHKAGKHAESMKALGEAKKILGI